MFVCETFTVVVEEEKKPRESVAMKVEGKMAFKIKSRMKWVGLVGLVLSTFSIFIHFLLARCTDGGVSDYQSSITIFSWRPIFENADLSTSVIVLSTDSLRISLQF